VLLPRPTLPNLSAGGPPRTRIERDFDIESIRRLREGSGAAPEATKARVHSRAQVLVFGEAPEQCEQLGALVFVERGGDRVLVLAGHATEFGEQLAALVG
jgi:uracil-DNA glycosylase